jgi:hypothetical protein
VATFAGVGVWLSVIRAMAAPVGGFSLLAMLVYVADKHPAVYARRRDALGKRSAPQRCRLAPWWMGAREVR